MKKPYHILIAEDHTILREGLRALLSSHADFRIEGEAQDGREALQSVEKQRPDLVLMDLSMPRTNGLEAIKDIKRGHPEVKVIALTGESGGRLADLSDVAIRAPERRTDRVQERHVQCYHALCEMLEMEFFDE